MKKFRYTKFLSSTFSVWNIKTYLVSCTGAQSNARRWCFPHLHSKWRTQDLGHRSAFADYSGSNFLHLRGPVEPSCTEPYLEKENVICGGINRLPGVWGIKIRNVLQIKACSMILWQRRWCCGLWNMNTTFNGFLWVLNRVLRSGGIHSLR